jgi:hypothetical protein
MPTLMAFSRQEAQFDTKLVKPEEMKDEEFMMLVALWGGRMGGGGGGLFGW